MATKLGVILADFTTQLATALVVGGTTATLQSATDDDGVALPSGRYFFTLDGSNSSKEHISCTLSGMALTSINSLSRQGVETSGVARAHRVGCTVTLTDFGHIKFINDLVAGTTTFNASTPLGYDGTASITTANQLATKAYVDGAAVALTGDQTVAGIKTFSSSPIVPTPTTSTQAANKTYVDGVAIAGAPDSSTSTKGITKMSVAPVSATAPISVGDNDPRVMDYAYSYTLGETISTGDAVAYDTATGKIFKSSAAALDKRINFIGWLLSGGVLNDVRTVAGTREYRGLSGLTSGSTYYLSDTQGAVSTSAGTVSRKVGVATSTTAIRRYAPGYAVGAVIVAPASGSTIVARMWFSGSSALSSVSFTLNSVAVVASSDSLGPLFFPLEVGDVISYANITNNYCRLIES